MSVAQSSRSVSDDGHSRRGEQALSKAVNRLRKKGPCHAERSEASLLTRRKHNRQILRFAQDDMRGRPLSAARAQGAASPKLRFLQLRIALTRLRERATAKRWVKDSLMLTERNNPSPPASPYPLPSERAVIRLGAVVNSKCPNSSLRACALGYTIPPLWGCARTSLADLVS